MCVDEIQVGRFYTVQVPADAIFLIVEIRDSRVFYLTYTMNFVLLSREVKNHPLVEFAAQAKEDLTPKYKFPSKNVLPNVFDYVKF